MGWEAVADYYIRNPYYPAGKPEPEIIQRPQEPRPLPKIVDTIERCEEEAEN